MSKFASEVRNLVVFFGADLKHIFGSFVGIDYGVLFEKKRPHKPKFEYDGVRILSLMIKTGFIEYIIVGDTKAPLLRCCFPFISKLETANIIFIGQHMNYQTVKNLQFRTPLENSTSIHTDLRDKSGEKIPFVLSTSFVLFDV